MAHTYSHLYGLSATGLRFFTVYGPWARPDMALSLFTRAMLAGEPIEVYNHGRMVRYIDDIRGGPDFTYIEAIEAALGITAEKRYLPLQPGDVLATAADTTALEAWTGFRPRTPVREGVARFVDWYRQFHGV
jgi:UDP-glucuronate 4-epimerase